MAPNFVSALKIYIFIIFLFIFIFTHNQLEINHSACRNEDCE